MKTASTLFKIMTRIGQNMKGMTEMETTYLGRDGCGKLTWNDFRLANKFSDCVKKRS
jgi:hypothetical protein